jgi:DNA-binding NtrC family response regulator
MGKLNILYAEGDAETMKTQAAGMQQAGHQVQTAEGRKAVLQAVEKGNFDLIVLGGTMTRDDRHHLTYKVKKAQANVKVLVLHSDGARHPYVDGNVDTGVDVRHIVEKIAQMMPARAAAKAAGAGK